MHTSLPSFCVRACCLRSITVKPVRWRCSNWRAVKRCAQNRKTGSSHDAAAFSICAVVCCLDLYSFDFYR